MMHKYSAQQAPQKPHPTVSIVGARGYSGLELAKLLLKHPQVNFTHAFATREFHLSEDLTAPNAGHVTCLKDDAVLKHLTDIVFLATPAEVSLHLAPQIVKEGKSVIDLSGAFRLKSSDYTKWYGFTHDQGQHLKDAEYGLAPFCGPTPAKLIANPGCYATAVNLALIPLLKANLIEPQSIVIDAKSGTTGAGRKAAEHLNFSEVTEDCTPYKIGKHQHLPEISETVTRLSGHAINPHFVTHLLPVKRGITAGIYATATTTELTDIEHAFNLTYGEYPLVRHAPNATNLTRLQLVAGTPYAHLTYTLTGNKLYVFSVIDNLMKGAASQAVENLNRFLDLPLTYALHEEA